MIQIIALTIGVLAFYLYVLAVWNRFGVLKSVSGSTYRFEGQDRWWFLAGTWLPAFAMLMQGLGVFGFLSAAGLLFTGLTINHRVNIAQSRIIHYAGAVVAILSPLIGFIILSGHWLPLVGWVIVTAGFYSITIRWVWWAEVFAVAFMVAGILTI